MGKVYIGYGDIFCPHCGDRRDKGAKKCSRCGKLYSLEASMKGVPAYGAAGIGWTPYANDPSLKRHRKREKRGIRISMLIVSVIIAIVILVSSHMSLDDIVHGGFLLVFGPLGIIWVFWLIWYGAQYGKSKDWEGTVTNKDMKTYESKRKDDEGNYWTETTTYYNVYFRDTKGKEHKLVQSSVGGWYEYLNVGDKVRYHGKNTSYYEKYDKSQSEVIPCAGCGRSCDARASYCSNCGTVLFKAAQPAVMQTQPATQPAEMQAQPVERPTQSAGVPEDSAVPCFCENCGTRFTPGSKFCKKCGTKL